MYWKFTVFIAWVCTYIGRCVSMTTKVWYYYSMWRAQNQSGLTTYFMMKLASFPGLPIVQYLIACSMQKWRRKPWSSIFIMWMTLCLYQGRQRGEESLIERTHFVMRSSFWIRSGTFFTRWMFKTPVLEVVQDKATSSYWNHTNKIDTF